VSLGFGNGNEGWGIGGRVWGMRDRGWCIEPEACTNVPPGAKRGEGHNEWREDVDRVDVEHRDTYAEVWCMG